MWLFCSIRILGAKADHLKRTACLLRKSITLKSYSTFIHFNLVFSDVFFFKKEGEMIFLYL